MLSELEIDNILNNKPNDFPSFAVKNVRHILYVRKFFNSTLINQVAYAINDTYLLPSYNIGQHWRTQQLSENFGGIIKNIAHDTIVHGDNFVSVTQVTVE